MSQEDPRNKLVELYLSEQQKLDKLLLLISTGTLALSMNLVFVQKIYFSYLYLLFISWGFFISTIVVQSLGYFFSTIWINRKLRGENSNPYSSLVNTCNILSLLFVVTGIISITFFAGNNINRINKEIISSKEYPNVFNK